MGRVKNAVSTGSFEELAMPLFDQLYNFAQWMTHNREGAEDLVQKTFAKALKSFPSFRIGTNFRAWMYRILRNTFLTSSTRLKAPMTVPSISMRTELKCQFSPIRGDGSTCAVKSPGAPDRDR
jgi:DNA-directed RNA polymerase specialized sigma24 family protein